MARLDLLHLPEGSMYLCGIYIYIQYIYIYNIYIYIYIYIMYLCGTYLGPKDTLYSIYLGPKDTVKELLEGPSIYYIGTWILRVVGVLSR